MGWIPTEVIRIVFFTSCGSLIPFTGAGFSWVSFSTLIYTSELILCSIICVHGGTLHNIYMFEVFVPQHSSIIQLVTNSISFFILLVNSSWLVSYISKSFLLKSKRILRTFSKLCCHVGQSREFLILSDVSRDGFWWIIGNKQSTSQRG